MGRQLERLAEVDANLSDVMRAVDSTQSDLEATEARRLTWVVGQQQLRQARGLQRLVAGSCAALLRTAFRWCAFRRLGTRRGVPRHDTMSRARLCW